MQAGDRGTQTLGQVAGHPPRVLTLGVQWPGEQGREHCGIYPHGGVSGGQETGSRERRGGAGRLEQGACQGAGNPGSDTGTLGTPTSRVVV